MKIKLFKNTSRNHELGLNMPEKQGKIIRESIREIRERYIQTPYT